MAKSLLERFTLKYVIDPITGCWNWTGSRTNDGYGQIGVVVEGVWRTRYAHRISWELFRGPIPEGRHVLHSCDSPPCVNPDHLFLGTDADNVADRDAKGRGRWHSGEKNGNAKLSDQDADDIRCSAESRAVLCTRYNVAGNTIDNIRSGRFRTSKGPQNSS